MTEHPDVALVRRGYEAFNKGDMETLASLLTADCTHHVPGDHQLSGHHKGRDKVLAMYARLAELTHGTFSLDLHDVFTDGRGHVISVYTTRADRGNRGLEMRGGIFFTIIGGKVSDLDECIADIDEANAFFGQEE
ncbi:nuclear transport factor 2 family protein [Streptomyces sp. MUM 203J]|uniref:nuclear transport factor 2 family protein n=1 Tax=Streptomyces sp. MUM 203J TaxID=2791990 RepID=UPI001F049D82|nr:nuclear transport factor 2 family protein [Streptomyces sp. MUM 203J]MCH0539385.1 nuclear transport factor 2 family protein [Streptomyces sp. MUM 203J]